MIQEELNYKVQFDGEITALSNKLKSLKDDINKTFGEGKIAGANQMFRTMENSIDKLREKASQPINSKAVFESMAAGAAKVDVQLDNLRETFVSLKDATKGKKIELLSEEDQKRLMGVNTALSEYKKNIKAAQKTTEAYQTVNKKYNETLTKKLELETKIVSVKNSVASTEKDIEGLKQSTAAYKANIEVIQKYIDLEKQAAKKDSTVSVDERNTARQAAVKASEGLGLPEVKTIDDARVALKVLTGTQNSSIQTMKKWSAQVATQKLELKELQRQLDTTDKAAIGWKNSLDIEGKKKENDVTSKQNGAYTALFHQAKAYGAKIDDVSNGVYSEESANLLRDRLQTIANEIVSNLNQTLQQFGDNCADAKQSAGDLGNSIHESRAEFDKLDERLSDQQAFASRLQQFVGIQGAAMVMRKALYSAFQTIKELDNAMTEMAVVTDFDIGDYWEQLPEYTKRANELGIAIKETYNSTAQFYQQGGAPENLILRRFQSLKFIQLRGNLRANLTNLCW